MEERRRRRKKSSKNRRVKRSYHKSKKNEIKNKYNDIFLEIKNVSLTRVRDLIKDVLDSSDELFITDSYKDTLNKRVQHLNEFLALFPDADLSTCYLWENSFFQELLFDKLIASSINVDDEDLKKFLKDNIKWLFVDEVFEKFKNLINNNSTLEYFQNILTEVKNNKNHNFLYFDLKVANKKIVIGGG